NNGLFTPWQLSECRTVPPAAFSDPGPPLAPARGPDGPLLYTPRLRYPQRNPEELPADVTFSPFAALGAPAVRCRGRTGCTRPGRRVLRRLRHCAGRPGPAAPGDGRAAVRPFARRQAHGPARRHPALPGPHGGRPRAP